MAARAPIVMLAVLLLASTARSQTVSCSGVAEWNAATIYQPGTRLTYRSGLYEAAIQIWNAPPDHCPSCGWYRSVGTCGTSGGNTPPIANAGADFAISEGTAAT